MSIPSIDPQALQQRFQGETPPLLIDVRTPGEFAALHVDGAVNHPLDQLSPAQLPEGSKDREVLLICQSGQRSQQAANTLQEAGWQQVCVVEGGTQACQRAGLPLQRGRGTLPLDRQVQITVGVLILSGVALGFWLHPAWLIVAAFVGAGLLFAGLSGTCGLALVLAAMPWNRGPRAQSPCDSGACPLPKRDG